MGPDGNWVEVQIRSERMDEIAEKGFAAHWKYKIGESEEESELNSWLRTIQDILDNPEPNAIDFLDTLKLNLFASEIVVFTPKGELLSLPVNSTVLDVAFNLHSNLGYHCIAGKVNHRLVPLSQKLNSGDQVEVLTSQSQTPKPEWINFLATAKAKTQLRKALRQEMRPVVNKGREIYGEFLKNNQIENSNEVLTKLMGLVHSENLEDLFAALGREEVILNDFYAKALRKQASSKGLLSKIFRLGKNNSEEHHATSTLTQSESDKLAPEINRKETYRLSYDPHGESNFKFAECCHPIPGDSVLGFIDDDGKVEIHAIDCPRAQALKASFGSRLLSTSWATTAGSFPALVRIEGIDRFGILQELIGVISSQLSINIRAMHIDTDNEVFTCDLSLRVPNSVIVDGLCDAVKQINGVKKALRIKVAGH